MSAVPKLSFNLDLQAPAKALARAHAAFDGAITELERLTNKRAQLQQEDQEILKGASLEDRETFRAISDVRLTLEILERKFAELTQFAAEAGPALALQTRQFIRLAEPVIAAAESDLRKQRHAVERYALEPYQRHLSWLDSSEAQIEKLKRVFPDLDYNSKLDGHDQVLRNCSRMLAGISQATAPLPPAPEISKQ